MKNLRKFLALIMTVAMLAGLFAIVGPVAGAAEEEAEEATTTSTTTASSIDPVSYTDQDQIKNDSYEQAIQLFSKMKVLDGYPSGEFQPNGLLTRAEGAAMIARTLISREAADILNTNTGPFGDVAADHWAAGAIAFAQNRLLITGVGGGMYEPGKNLTKAQWLKILLCSLGYGANHEFEGAGWADRVFEAATNPDVDLFGRYDRDWFELDTIEVHRISIPEDGLNDPIQREEAIALLRNAVIMTRKVVYDRLTDTYKAYDASAGLSGSNWWYIRDDIGLMLWPNEVRDNYGRPHDWTIYYGYRNEWIYSEPTKTPTLLITYKGAQTGNQLRTALQGVLGDLTALQMTDKVNLFTNGYINSGWYTLTASSTSLNLWEYKPNLALFPTGTYRVASAWEVLEAYLALKGNSAAFGSAVTIEIFEYKTAKEENKEIDIVIKAPFLTELSRKVADDSATLLIDETSIQFQVFNTVEGTEQHELEVYARGNKGLSNFKDLYDNAASGSYWFATPYCYLSPRAADVDSPFMFNVYGQNPGGPLAPVTHEYVIKPRIKPDAAKPPIPPAASYILYPGQVDSIYADYEAGADLGLIIKNEELRPINEVYEPAKTMVGAATATSPTRLTVGGTGYNRALISPTIVDGDFTNNYTYYLDEDSVVLGAVYTAPGTPNMGGFLWLKTAEGSATGMSLKDDSWAKATVILGTGRTATINLLINSSDQFWNPMNGPALSGAYSKLPPDPGGSLLGIDGLVGGFYAYTVVDGMYRLTKLPTELKVLNGDATSPNIRRGYQGVGNYTDAAGLKNVTASNRTILTVIDGNGVRYYTGFDNFPVKDLTFDSGDGHALVRLEPGGRNVAAEILYINTGTTEIGPPIMYAYLVEDTGLNTSGGYYTANFVGDDGQLHEDMIISNYVDAVTGDLIVDILSTRFYVLINRVGNEWEANPLWEGFATPIDRGGTIPVSTATVRSGYYRELTSNGFGLCATVNGATNLWFDWRNTNMRVVSVPWDTSLVQGELKDEGTKGAIANIDKYRLIAVLEDDGDSYVAFVFKENIGRKDIAGIN